ncbi:hypothetical protein ONS96_004845 [Cadophora gregata f. sp. sojae]|nr:hypothetical protein ONS96_004845 [Cadophora gregata f. sp. sojae]
MADTDSNLTRGPQPTIKTGSAVVRSRNNNNEHSISDTRDFNNSNNDDESDNNGREADKTSQVKEWAPRTDEERVIEDQLFQTHLIVLRELGMKERDAKKAANKKARKDMIRLHKTKDRASKRSENTDKTTSESLQSAQKKNYTSASKSSKKKHTPNNGPPKQNHSSSSKGAPKQSHISASNSASDSGEATTKTSLSDATSGSVPSIKQTPASTVPAHSTNSEASNTLKTLPPVNIENCHLPGLTPPRNLKLIGSTISQAITEADMNRVIPPQVPPLVIRSVERILGVFDDDGRLSQWLSDDSIEETLKTFHVPDSIHVFAGGWASTYKPSDRLMPCFLNQSVQEWILTFNYGLHFTVAHISKNTHTVRYYDSMASTTIPQKEKRQAIALLEQHKRVIGDNWTHIRGNCQQQTDSHNCGIFALHNIECILQGYEAILFKVVPEMLREKYATAISQNSDHAAYHDIFESMLSKYWQENNEKIMQGWASYSSTRATLQKSQILLNRYQVEQMTPTEKAAVSNEKLPHSMEPRQIADDMLITPVLDTVLDKPSQILSATPHSTNEKPIGLWSPNASIIPETPMHTYQKRPSRIPPQLSFPSALPLLSSRPVRIPPFSNIPLSEQSRPLSQSTKKRELHGTVSPPPAKHRAIAAMQSSSNLPSKKLRIPVLQIDEHIDNSPIMGGPAGYEKQPNSSWRSVRADDDAPTSAQPFASKALSDSQKYELDAVKHKPQDRGSKGSSHMPEVTDNDSFFDISDAEDNIPRDYSSGVVALASGKTPSLSPLERPPRRFYTARQPQYLPPGSFLTEDKLPRRAEEIRQLLTRAPIEDILVASRSSPSRGNHRGENFEPGDSLVKKLYASIGIDGDIDHTRLARVHLSEHKSSMPIPSYAEYTTDAAELGFQAVFLGHDIGATILLIVVGPEGASKDPTGWVRF